MDTWDYRVIRREDKEKGASTYQIYEVFYDEDDNITVWTESSVEPSGETFDELLRDLEFYCEATKKPVLVEEEQNGEPVLVPEKV